MTLRAAELFRQLSAEPALATCQQARAQAACVRGLVAAAEAQLKAALLAQDHVLAHVIEAEMRALGARLRAHADAYALAGAALQSSAAFRACAAYCRYYKIPLAVFAAVAPELVRLFATYHGPKP